MQKPEEKKGLFIVIEGIDASGKKVQSKLLRNKLKEINNSCLCRFSGI